jgi:hypothetical protein
MAADWFVWFDKESEAAPSKEDLGKALEDFLGEFATRVYWRKDRWFAVLVGTKTWPFKRIVEPDHPLFEAHKAEEEEERWIEVWRSPRCVDVMTRRGDWATNTLATGFAKLVAQYWKGRTEEKI